MKLFKRSLRHVRAPFVAAGGGGYSGPGDVVASATGWWGLRAYSAATRGNNCVRLWRSTDFAQSDFVTLSDGSLDVASITTWGTGATLRVWTLYDQSGNGHNFTNTADTTSAGSKPAFILSGLGSKPVMRGTLSGVTQLSGALGSAVTQPFTASVVSKRTGSFTTEAYIFGGATGSVAAGSYSSNANKVRMYAGSLSADVTASDSAFHALQYVYSGSSSLINVDGVDSSALSPGGNSLPATTWMFGAEGVAPGLDADITELGIWPSAFSSGTSTSMKNNQQAYWGY